MDKTYRTIVGKPMIDSLMVLIRAYSQMAHGDIDEFEAGQTMAMEADMILAEISMMNELKLWEVSTCMRVAEITVGLKQLVKARIINKKRVSKDAPEKQR